MKPLKRIAILLVGVSAIVVFWLSPNINTAGNVQYTRRYEDTDKTAVLVNQDTTGRKNSARLKPETPMQTKAYKEESIKSGEKIAKIRPSMFSRAIQFDEKEIEVVLDSINEVELVVVADTVKQINN